MRSRYYSYRTYRKYPIKAYEANRNEFQSSYYEFKCSLLNIKMKIINAWELTRSISPHPLDGCVYVGVWVSVRALLLSPGPSAHEHFWSYHFECKQTREMLKNFTKIALKTHRKPLNKWWDSHFNNFLFLSVSSYLSLSVMLNTIFSLEKMLMKKIQSENFSAMRTAASWMATVAMTLHTSSDAG